MKKPQQKSYVANQFQKKAELFEAKDKEYGDNYLRAGNVMRHMFPEGLDLVSPEDFNRFALINQMVNKIMRYSQNFKKGGHIDSLDDLSIYAMMCKEADAVFSINHKGDK